MPIPTQTPWWRPAVRLAAMISGWIAIPIILALFIGKQLDERYGTKPWIFLGLTAFAFTISIIGIIRESVRSMKDIEAQSKTHDQQQKNN